MLAKRLLRNALLSSLMGLCLSAPNLYAQKFYPDDPLEKEPPPMPVMDAERRELSEILEWASAQFGDPGERHPEIGVIPGMGVNTLGEVMDGPWYQNRHGRNRMSLEELERGTGDDRPPLRNAPWKALTVKSFGVRPGILIADSKYQLYLLRFDPPDYLEMSTGATMVASKIVYALGYNVLENYIVYFERDQLVASDAGEDVTSMGERRDLTEEDIDNFLRRVARDPEKGYRAVATRVPGAWEGLLGPFQVFGTRSDDPNDIVPHEHRRDLRGLFVFSAWLNNAYMSALHTLDALVIENDVPYIRHYLVDFYTALGSARDSRKKAHEGNDLLFDRGQTLKNIAGMGFYSQRWMRAKYPKFSSVGRFEYVTFEPEKWTTEYELAPFANRLPDDTYWAAKQVMAFTDEELRVLVATGQYSDPDAEEWIAQCLIARRDKIGQTYLKKVLPLDNFRLENGELAFDNLEAKYGFVSSPQSYNVQWSRFDNDIEKHTPIGGKGTTFEVPSIVETGEEGVYVAAKIWAEDPQTSVSVFMRKESGDLKVVGVDRNWPDKLLADAAQDFDTGRSRYVDLKQVKKDLFDPYAEAYNERTGRSLSPQEYFDSMTISERTTFDAVTHALINSTLTDEEGNSLGRAIDLVKGIERIAGQYYGRGGDQQFRLYVFLEPNTRETLEKSKEFFLGHENTVYHVGYPTSFRQEGKVPNIQFSVSDDSTRADIDVDYRSSKIPQAMFNGHLTSANSDVRAGDNYEKHNGRWGGFVAWWQGIFGQFKERDETVQRDILYTEPPEEPTPLPPNRARGVKIDQIHDAVQEFLTDWLVRGDVEEAMEFMSPRSYACLNLDDFAGREALGAQQARETLKDLMELAVDELGDRDNLTEAIDEVIPRSKTTRVISHPYERDFTVDEMTNELAEQYVCGDVPARPAGTGDQYGTYWGVVFRFKDENSGVLGLLWTREEGNWRIVSYKSFPQ
jgi:hypothetical protein